MLGDSALTAAHVAHAVGMCELPVAIAEAATSGGLAWRMPDDSLRPFAVKDLPTLVKTHTLGLTGGAVDVLTAEGTLSHAVLYCQVCDSLWKGVS